MKDLLKKHFRLLLGGAVACLVLWIIGRESKNYSLEEIIRAPSLPYPFTGF
ncbi:MAG: hypothetical protein JW971_01545 [Synergistales bacterium]|nr:hypothetical protein [Synergistales bacterium]